MTNKINAYTSTQEPGTVVLRSVPQDELSVLRRRVKAQRAELRRLNKILGPYWRGFSAGLASERESVLRGKMIRAFGHEAVFAAEHRND